MPESCDTAGVPLPVCAKFVLISEEEFLILYQEYESVNPLYPYREFEPFCLDSLNSSECQSAKGNWFINKICGYNYVLPFFSAFLLCHGGLWITLH